MCPHRKTIHGTRTGSAKEAPPQVEYDFRHRTESARIVGGVVDPTPYLLHGVSEESLGGTLHDLAVERMDSVMRDPFDRVGQDRAKWNAGEIGAVLPRQEHIGPR